MQAVPVILCGGSGTRLGGMPKQFRTLTNAYSLLQNTAMRALWLGARAEDIVAVTVADYAEETKAHLEPLACTHHILCEPAARNTAPAIAFAALYAAKTFGDDIMLWVLPADHHIAHEAVLGTALKHAMEIALQGRLVTFGIPARTPETGYGYIRKGAALSDAAFDVESFTEKPDIETAQGFIHAGNYLWNSGMFVFTAKTVLDEFAAHAPEILAGASDPKLYAALAKTPFDKAIMEKSTRRAVVPCDMGWSDLGTLENVLALKKIAA